MVDGASNAQSSIDRNRALTFLLEDLRQPVVTGKYRRVPHSAAQTRQNPRIMLFPSVLLGLSLLSMHSATNDFTYDGTHGPSQWEKEYQTCAGKHQSPINIEEHNVKNVSLPTLRFMGLQKPRSSILMNNGHTVMIKANDSEAAMISGGPLDNEVYVFEQLHFHWGENDREGSEDLINNHSFAMELHAVFYKQSYKSMSEAVNHPDGLTVLAYFYEVGNESNPTYDAIVRALPGIETVGAEKALDEAVLLSKLLVPNPSTMQDYYTYEGSLTTPPCFEVVTWIDFKNPQLLSHEELAAFRNMQSVDGHKLTHNFRPIQPLDDRIVYHNIPQDDKTHQDDKDSDDKSGQPRIEAFTSHLTLAVLLGTILFVSQ